MDAIVHSRMPDTGNMGLSRPSSCCCCSSSRSSNAASESGRCIMMQRRGRFATSNEVYRPSCLCNSLEGRSSGACCCSNASAACGTRSSCSVTSRSSPAGSTSSTAPSSIESWAPSSLLHPPGGYTTIEVRRSRFLVTTTSHRPACLMQGALPAAGHAQHGDRLAAGEDLTGRGAAASSTAQLCLQPAAPAAATAEHDLPVAVTPPAAAAVVLAAAAPQPVQQLDVAVSAPAASSSSSSSAQRSALWRPALISRLQKSFQAFAAAHPALFSHHHMSSSSQPLRPAASVGRPVTYRVGRFTVREEVLFGPHWKDPQQPLRRLAAAAAADAERLQVELQAALTPASRRQTEEHQHKLSSRQQTQCSQQLDSSSSSLQAPATASAAAPMVTATAMEQQLPQSNLDRQQQQQQHQQQHGVSSAGKGVIGTGLRCLQRLSRHSRLPKPAASEVMETAAQQLVPQPQPSLKQQQQRRQSHGRLSMTGKLKHAVLELLRVGHDSSSDNGSSGSSGSRCTTWDSVPAEAAGKPAVAQALNVVVIRAP